MKRTVNLGCCMAVFLAGALAAAGGSDGQAKAETRKAAAKARAEAAAAKRAELKAERQEKLADRGAAYIDRRQNRQGKRIQHGIRKGYLTEAEVAKLNAQQAAIANLETSVFADGKLTGAEFKSIRLELNEASRCIWAEKHDTEGGQMPTYRLGGNVFAKDDFTAKLENEALPLDEARALMKDFHRLTELKRKLSSDDLSDSARAKLQSEYDDLLNQYFETRE